MLYHWIKLGNLLEKARQNKHIQMVIALVPGLFCFVFTSAFLIDLFNTFGVLAVNNNYAESTIESHMLFDVEGKNNIINIIKAKEIDVTPQEDGLVCSIRVIPNGYEYIVGEERIDISKVDFIKHDTETDLYYINGNEEGVVEPSHSRICNVYLKDDVFYTDDGIKEIPLEEDNNTVFSLKNESTVHIIPSFVAPLPSTEEMYFVNCLEDTDLHYDGLTQAYVRNVSKDFLKNFLVGTHVLIFGSIVILYVIALLYANQHYHFEYFSSKPVIAVNVVGLLALIIGLLLAVILLG